MTEEEIMTKIVELHSEPANMSLREIQSELKDQGVTYPQVKQLHTRAFRLGMFNQDDEGE